MLFWLGLLVGLMAGATLGMFALCIMTSRRHYELCEALDWCRKELAAPAMASSHAMYACTYATKVLNENGWLVEVKGK